MEDANLIAKRNQVVSDLEDLDVFSSVSFHPIGADELRQMYTNTKNAIVREFAFEKRCDLPTADGVEQAFIGCVPFSEFRRLVEDDNGAEIVSTIFEENVGDYGGDTPVNAGIKKSLDALMPAFKAHASIADEVAHIKMWAARRLPVVSSSRTRVLFTEPGFFAPREIFRSLWYHCWTCTRPVI